MHKYILRWMLLPVLCMAAACNKDTEAPASPIVTNVMIYNGSTAFFVKPSSVFVDTAFLALRTYNGIDNAPMGLTTGANYSWLAPGRHRIGFTDTSGNKISERYEVLDKDKFYTFYLADSIGYYTVLMSEEHSAGRPGDKARLRLVHLSPDSGPVDFFIDTEKVNGLQDITYKTITPFIEVAPMDNPSFRVKRGDAPEEEPQLVRKSLALLPGRSYTFILRGYIQEQHGDPNSTIDLSAIRNF